MIFFFILHNLLIRFLFNIFIIWTLIKYMCVKYLVKTCCKVIAVVDDVRRIYRLAIDINLEFQTEWPVFCMFCIR